MLYKLLHRNSDLFVVVNELKSECMTIDYLKHADFVAAALLIDIIEI